MEWFTGFDAKTRTLAVLALGAVLSLALALWAVLGQRPVGQATLEEPVAAFPGLEDLAGGLSGLTLVTAEDEVRLTQRPDGQWVVANRHGYPARIPPLIAAVRGLVELKLAEPKTANPERHALIGLGDPADGGTAVRVRLEGTGGAPLADLLVGNAVPPGLDGTARQYVRRPGEDQTWLAAGTLELETELHAWLRQGVVEIDRERIQSMDLALKDAPRYRLVPEAEGRQRYFRPDPMPAGQRVKDRFQTNSIASIFEDLRILDVRPRAELDFSNADRITYRTREGLTIDLEWVEEGDKVWIAVFAGADPPPGEPATEAPAPAEPENTPPEDPTFEPPLGEPASAARSAELDADAIEKATGNWAFQIPNYKADQLDTPMADLIEPLPEPEPVPAPVAGPALGPGAGPGAANPGETLHTPDAGFDPALPPGTANPVPDEMLAPPAE